ncbi:ADP-ribosylation factor-related protein [Tieghemostelium lacteum]|uniref:ADP-ribosylation factor-related protein n=1 Tax=Tieghemostelium lacteum TaxID=361077 RepID=A0A151ZEJ7_TIELA|nr:ADP-ribosylation factor-related protein [Tieghemostelium lacteum]|eukprot:KYQ92339.1 ADP-ribosylation factor-related protein [Tieghemostelium lacteum]
MGVIFSKGYLPELPVGSLIKLGIIGLENAGKTTLLHKFIDSSYRKSIDSVLISMGVSIESIVYKGWDMFIGDLLYPEYIRKTYKPYLMGCDVVIFVVDSTDYANITAAKEQLDLLLVEDCISSSVFLVLANKQDQKKKMEPIQIENYLELYRLNIPWKCIATSFDTDFGIDESIKWILENTTKRTLYQ